jgi:hypothetical protein
MGMQCIYFNLKEEICQAQPMVDSRNPAYEPIEEEKENLCISKQFRDCPRYGAILEYLEVKNRE